MSDSCAGACCSVFPMRAETLARLRKKPSGFTDGPYILDMLIPLTRRQALRRSRRLGYPDPPRYGNHKGGRKSPLLLFTCRHWDEETRLCTDYANRPKMCSEYPYGNPCERGCRYTNTVAVTKEG